MLQLIYTIVIDIGMDYFRVAIFSIGQVLTTTVHFAQRFKVLFYFD